jgi:hypothetical protein
MNPPPGRPPDRPQQRPGEPPTPYDARAPVAVGELIDLKEYQYRYGRGPLRLRVTAIGDTTASADPHWLELSGVPVRWDGSDGQLRTVWVHTAALQLPQRRRP